MEIIGGFELTMLKKLNGAILIVPVSDFVVTKAIGLGIMLPVKNL
jgi:hypothetical protein